MNMAIAYAQGRRCGVRPDPVRCRAEARDAKRGIWAGGASTPLQAMHAPRCYLPEVLIET